MVGRLTDQEYRKRDYCLIVNNAAIGSEKYGIVKDIYGKYPYGDIISTRDKLKNPTRAVLTDRKKPGSLVLCKPPGYPSTNLPCIGNITAQFGYGLEIENNEKVQRLLNIAGDDHFIENVQVDTADNRIQYFKTCIETLKLQAILRENDTIMEYILPLGIGRRGIADEIWMRFYFSEIQELCSFLITYGIRVSILCAPQQKIPQELQEFIKSTSKENTGVFEKELSFKLTLAPRLQENADLKAQILPVTDGILEFPSKPNHSSDADSYMTCKRSLSL